MKSIEQILEKVQSAKSSTSKKIDISIIISDQVKVPIAIAKKGIREGLFTINGKKIFSHEIVYWSGSILRFGRQEIAMETTQPLTAFDKLVIEVLAEIGESDVTKVSSINRPKLCSYIIAYFSVVPYENDELVNSIYAQNAFAQMEGYYKDCQLNARDGKIPKRKELVETLVKLRSEKIRELISISENLEKGIYEKSLYRFLQDYSRITGSIGFNYTIAPIVPSERWSRASIEMLIKPITSIVGIVDSGERFIHFEEHKIAYHSYIGSLNPQNTIEVNVYCKMANALLGTFQKLCNVENLKAARLKIESGNRRYNFENVGRIKFDLQVIVKNIGEGLARDIKLVSGGPNFVFSEVRVGPLRTGEAREIAIEATLSRNESFTPHLTLECTWLDVSQERKSFSQVIELKTQDQDVPWEELESQKPYSIQEIEDRDKLYGRDSILNELSTNIRSSKIESYKIWGQKRVGKSSIVKTLKSSFLNDEKTIVIWRSIAGLKNTSAIQTLNNLGESLCSEIYEEVDRKLTNEAEKKQLKGVPVPAFDGSLFPLETYINKLKRLDRSLKFVFILDEFDRINEEFFLPNNLGDTLSLNIGKGLNVYNYVGFILVGSENMHLLDRQGINYNSYLEREIDTFDKESEYDSFKNIVGGPVAPFINFSEEAVERIFYVTNGNPYFANLICSNAFKISVKNRDSEVDLTTTSRAIELITGSSQKSHFEHFWGDGLTEESNIKKERKADIRRRILISCSYIWFQNKEYPTRLSIVKNFSKPSEYQVENYEIENTIKEFFNRKIFFEDGNLKIRIQPHLFEKWLQGPGRTLMIEGISDLEALEREKRLEQEYRIREEELLRLRENLIYKGERISIDRYKTYFEQFGDSIEQRRVFRLLDSAVYLSKAEINDFFKREQKNLFNKSVIEMRLGQRTPYRENTVELFSFSETISENIDIIESFKILSHIRSTKITREVASSVDSWRQGGVEEVILFESVVDDFKLISSRLGEFLALVKESISIRFVVLMITSKAKSELIKATSGRSNFKIIFYKEIEDTKIKPFVETSQILESSEERNYTFATLKKTFNSISKNSVNVLFETHCPAKSLPIYWQRTEIFEPLFHNPFHVSRVKEDLNEGEMRRDELYFSNKEFSQKLNKFIVRFLAERAKADEVTDWFSLKYVPRKVLDNVNKKWLDDKQADPRESYFDFIDYKEIIMQFSELQSLFMINDKELGNIQLKWIDKLNELRRDPAHVEKPVPSKEEVSYFNRIKDIVLPKLDGYLIKWDSV